MILAASKYADSLIGALSSLLIVVVLCEHSNANGEKCFPRWWSATVVINIERKIDKRDDWRHYSRKVFAQYVDYSGGKVLREEFPDRSSTFLRVGNSMYYTTNECCAIKEVVRQSDASSGIFKNRCLKDKNYNFVKKQLGNEIYELRGNDLVTIHSRVPADGTYLEKEVEVTHATIEIRCPQESAGQDATFCIPVKEVVIYRETSGRSTRKFKESLSYSKVRKHQQAFDELLFDIPAFCEEPSGSQVSPQIEACRRNIIKELKARDEYETNTYQPSKPLDPVDEQEWIKNHPSYYLPNIIYNKRATNPEQHLDTDKMSVDILPKKISHKKKKTHELKYRPTDRDRSKTYSNPDQSTISSNPMNLYINVDIE